VSGSVAAAILTANVIEVPLDEVFCLQSVNLQGVPGGAQVCEFMRIAIVDQAGSTVATIASWVNDLATARIDNHWSGEIWMMPREILQLECDFDAGAVANVLGAGVLGITVPRGNWQIG
jgi:hypothetical protein